MLFCNVKLGGTSIKAMIDGGAEVSLIRRDVANHLQNKKYIQWEAGTITGSTPGRREVHGAIETSLVIGEKRFQVQLGMVEDFPFKLLIGNNILRKTMKAVIDLNRDTITPRGGQPVGLIVTKGKDGTGMVNMHKEVTIPPETVHYLPLGRSKQKVEAYILSPIKGTTDRLIPRSIIKANRAGQLMLPVYNFGKKEVKLSKGMNVTTIEECGKIEIPAPKKASEGIEAKVIEEMEFEGLNEEQSRKLKKLLIRYRGRFTKENNFPRKAKVRGHEIGPPVATRPYRYSQVENQIIDREVDKMLEYNIIQESESPWCSPVVLVRKKNGKIRFCVDYRKLNQVTKKDSFPMPRIDDTLDWLEKAKWVTTLDLTAGYWQIPMDDKDKEKTAFRTRKGLFEFNTMPFGLVNAPATFQRMMQGAMDTLIGKTTSVYLDDIMTISKTFDENLGHLEEFLKKLEEKDLQLGIKKCKFMRRKLLFLGHLVDENGVCPDPAKTKAMMTMPPPTNVTGIREFLGLVGYYRRFIPEFTEIAEPLYRLLRKSEEFRWEERQQKAFEALIKILVAAPVLRFPNFKIPFEVQTDASGVGIGAVLSQEDQPIS